MSRGVWGAEEFEETDGPCIPQLVMTKNELADITPRAYRADDDVRA